MPLPNTMADLSVLAASCNPPGGEILGTLGDDYHRAIQSIVRRESARGADLVVVDGILTPGSDGNYFSVTASPANVTGIANTWVGREVTFVFQGSCTIVRSSSLLLPGGLNISGVPGRVYRFVQEASNPIWRLVATDSVVTPLPITLQLFTANGTWTRPVGCRRILVQVVGPGASGAGANAGNNSGPPPGLSAGGGGGAGGYSEALLNVESLPSASVVVPAGGVGAAGTVGSSGQGDTIFGSNLVVAKPGSASPGVGVTFSTVILSAGGFGGTLGTGTIAYAGEQGDHAITFSPANQCVPGKGGSTVFGSGGHSIIISSASTVTGVAGRGFGSGGSGGASLGQGAVAGGNGARGLCKVFEFY